MWYCVAMGQFDAAWWFVVCGGVFDTVKSRAFSGMRHLIMYTEKPAEERFYGIQFNRIACVFGP